MPTVFVPSLLRGFTDDRSLVRVPGRTLGEVFANLEAAYPGIGARIINDGRIRPEIAISVDDQLVDTGLLYAVDDGSEIFLLPAISGG